jgi:hypothetical protein
MFASVAENTLFLGLLKIKDFGYAQMKSETLTIVSVNVIIKL